MSGPSFSRLAAIEALPSELLQDIFLISNNFALPLSSPMIYAKLDSEFVKKSLIYAAFGTENIANDLHACQDHRSVQEEEYMGRSQGNLIGRPWATFQLLKEYHREALCKGAVQAFAYFNNHYRLSATEEAEANVSLAELVKQLTPDTEAKSLVGWSMSVSPKSCDNMAKFRVQIFDDQDVPNIITPPRMLIEIEHDSERQCTSGCTKPHGSRGISSYLDMPIVSSRIVVPSRVLRGPWTEDRLRLLHWLTVNFEVEHADGGNNFTFDQEAASHGLKNAIEGYCAPALALLVKPPSDCWWRSFVAVYTADGDVLTRRMGSLDVNDGDEEAILGSKINTDLTTDDSLAFFNVEIEEGHLVTALEAAVQRNDGGAKVFQWLLPLAVARQYDPEHTSQGSARNFVLVRWAIKKETEEKENGISDGLGSLALRLLEGQQRATMALFAHGVMENDESDGSGGG